VLCAQYMLNLSFDFRIIFRNMTRLACLLALLVTIRASSLAVASEVTFNKDVLPILEKNCQVCHRPGEIGPMSFISYESTRPWAKAIKEAVLTRKMPPWFADPEVGHFANERKLSSTEIQTLVDWADSGAYEGTFRKQTPKQWTQGWNINPDVIYEMPKPYTIPENGVLDYIYILLPAKFPRDTWIVDGEIQPGNRSAVHHASVIVRPPGSSWLKDARVGEPYIPPKTGPVAVENFNAPQDWLLGYVPGMSPQRNFDPEQKAGRRIPAGSDIFLELHYTGNGKRTEDITRVGLVVAKDPPARQALNLVVYDTSFEIPPHEALKIGTTWAILNDPVTLVYLQPHLHMRGTGMEILATYPDGRSETLLRVPRYNYMWQVVYILEKPLKLPKGTRIDVSATWDNSVNNKFNPDPSRTVRVGQQIWDEMLVAILGVTTNTETEPGKALTMGWNVR
jgi:hypothetical protein